MHYYRLYFMDRTGAHIDHFREFEADDDMAALDVAKGWRDGRPMELWSRNRKVKRWETLRLINRSKQPVHSACMAVTIGD
jgi:hypothetical protein